MENKLRLLYALQQVDLQLQEIHELKGDLPGIVATLEAKVDELETRRKELEKTLKQAKVRLCRANYRTQVDRFGSSRLGERDPRSETRLVRA